MAIVVKFAVEAMESSKYDSIISELEKIGEGAPDGRRYHLCYGDRRQLQVIDIFDSPAKLEAFGAKLMPILQRHGVKATPEVIGEVYNVIPG
jgi:hypothetical protein